MNVEWLWVKIAPEYREKFVRIDDEIWTSFLSKAPGFVKKEVWISPNDTSELIIVIHWTAQALQDPIPKETLDRIEQKFLEVLGVPFQLLESRFYQVRKSRDRY
jgi:uncharacterized protein (TIGR03792 family)